MKSFVLLFSLMMTAAVATAQVAGRESLPAADLALFNELLLEFPLEVKDFDQTREKPEVVTRFADDWKAFALKGRALPAAWGEGFSWSPFVNETLRPRANPSQTVGTGDRLETIDAAFPARTEHSIENPRLYAVQRIGEKIAEVLTKRGVRPILYAGSVDSVAGALGVSESMIRYLPSPYDSWGLRKGFVSGRAFADGKPRYLMLIPPSRQYLIHYADLFDSLGLKPERAILNHDDQSRQISRLQESFRRVRRQLPAAPDVIALGYYHNIQKALGPAAVLTGEIPIGDGLTVQLVEDIQSRKNTRYLIVKSDLTIWGESSAFVIEGALALKPKSVLFMGSAGGISAKTAVYDVSIPGSFVLEGRVLPVQNQIFETLKSSDGRLAGVVLGGTHGHTNSPIEQSKDYVSAKLKSGVDSIDVEQNLIAEAIQRHNRATGENVLFGAINLITDKPKSWHHEWTHEFDLSQINAERKGQARERSVMSALEAWRSSPLLKASAPSCGKAFHVAP